MPWLDNDNPPNLPDQSAYLKVSEWPQPNSSRIDARLRFEEGCGDSFAPRPSHYVVRIRPEIGPGATIYNGWLEVTVDTVGHAHGTTGLGPDGYEVELDITLYKTAPDPNFGKIGIEYRFTYHHTGFPDYWIAYMWATDDPTFGVLCVPFRMRVQFTSLGGFHFVATNYDPIVNTDWTRVILRDGWEYWGQPECWEFQPAAQFVAEFNDVDARINFSPKSVTLLPRWSVEFDIRPHSLADITVMGHSENTFTTLGFFFLFMRYNNMLINMGSRLPADVWTSVRMDYSWPIDDGFYRVFWDDVPRGLQELPMTGKVFDQMGANFDDIKGHFDLRLLKWVHGTPAAPITFIETALEQNACDVGPSAMKGTTFNMALPSCP